MLNLGPRVFVCPTPDRRSSLGTQCGTHQIQRSLFLFCTFDTFLTDEKVLLNRGEFNLLPDSAEAVAFKIVITDVLHPTRIVAPRTRCYRCGWEVRDMDLHALIQNFQAEKQRLEQTIAAMESLVSSTNGHRRGRKFMGQAERQQVSARMRKYWANRHKAS